MMKVLPVVIKKIRRTNDDDDDDDDDNDDDDDEVDDAEMKPKFFATTGTGPRTRTKLPLSHIFFKLRLQNTNDKINATGQYRRMKL